ncbi:MAG TPA: hypothetical protein P5060_04220 [Candidatus Absconditabacterales bacterium]|nr:hypothetical protein [Candidatus Absconditabacterales bacterium]
MKKDFYEKLQSQKREKQKRKYENLTYISLLGELVSVFGLLFISIWFFIPFIVTATLFVIFLNKRFNVSMKPIIEMLEKITKKNDL